MGLQPCRSDMAVMLRYNPAFYRNDGGITSYGEISVDE
jgi:hypothetical protein